MDRGKDRSEIVRQRETKKVRERQTDKESMRYEGSMFSEFIEHIVCS